jgi:hypothetical protein
VPDPTLFDQAERDPLLRTMDAVIAPVAASANALVDDMEQLEIADAVRRRRARRARACCG